MGLQSFEANCYCNGGLAPSCLSCSGDAAEQDAQIENAKPEASEAVAIGGVQPSPKAQGIFAGGKGEGKLPCLRLISPGAAGVGA